MQIIRYVSKNTDGNYPNDYLTIAAAIKSVPVNNTQKITIFIRKGIYKEKIIVDRPNITLEGEDIEQTVITYSDYSLMILEDGVKRGTFRTPTVFVNTHDVTFCNLTIKNEAGPGSKVGPALALYVDGDRIGFEHCKILGSHHTLFSAPLPPVSKEPGGFSGPKEFAPRTHGRHCYDCCTIQGGVDFIFGSGTDYFQNCTIYSESSGYIACASTPKDKPYGLIFESCTLTGSCPDNSVYLGRPWRNYAKIVFLNCRMGKHIKYEGWSDGGNADVHNLVFFAEYNSLTQDGQPLNIDMREDYIVKLTKEQATAFTREKVLRGKDGWNFHPQL